MNAIEILINYSKLETVQNLVDNIDLVTDIIKVHISEYSDSNAGVVPDTFAMRFSRL